MKSEMIRQEITASNNAKLELVTELDTKRADLIQMLKPFIKSELQRIVESSVKRNTEHTKSIGIEALSQMKKDLNTLLNSSESLVDSVFANDELWIHIDYSIVPGGDSFGQQYNNQKAAKSKIESGIKFALGKAGKILVDYEYEKAQSINDRTAQWQRLPNAEIVFGSNYGFQMPKELENAIKSYCDEIGKLHGILDKLIGLNKMLAEQEAMELWEQA